MQGAAGVVPSTQVPPGGPLQPVLHVQSVIASLPATLMLLTGQPVQESAVFVPALKKPALQAVQDVPLRYSPGPHCVTAGVVGWQ